MRMDLPLCSFNYCRHYFDGNCIAKDGKREGCEFKALEDILYAPGGSERITLDRLRELVTAEVEGRAVVLPCKRGQHVFVKRDSQICEGEVISVTGKMRNGYFEVWATIVYTWHGKKHDYEVRGNYGASSFGKTVFLTRAEAEQALVRAEAEAKGEQE